MCIRDRVYADADGDLKFSSGLTWDGTDIATTGTITVNSRLRISDNRIITLTTNDDIDLDPAGTGKVNIIGTTQTGVGSAGGATNVPAAPTLYVQVKINGQTLVIPAFAVS